MRESDTIKDPDVKMLMQMHRGRLQDKARLYSLPCYGEKRELAERIAKYERDETARMWRGISGRR